MSRRPEATRPGPRNDGDELEVLTYAEAAQRIRGTERFIRRLVERRELDYMRVGRSNVVFAASLERWIEANRVPAAR